MNPRDFGRDSAEQPFVTGEDRVAAALRAPLPPARPSADPSALWACGRHARRISTEAKISLVVTAAQVSGLIGVLCVLISYVDWPELWRMCASLAAATPRSGVYGIAALLLLAVALAVHASLPGRTRRT